jgi:GNAT superfamily N-acetyltransferase
VRGESEAEVKRVTAADIEELVALARAIWYLYYPAIISIAQIDYMLEQRYAGDVLRGELTRADLWWDQLRIADRMIGFASYFKVDADEMKLDKLYVHPDEQRRGYGALLMERPLRVAREQGCCKLTLAVNKHNATAIAAYEKYGMRTVAAVTKDIGNGFVMDDYVMAKAV